MTPKSRNRLNKPNMSPSRGPKKSAVADNQINQFPGIGVTLSSYSKQSFKTNQPTAQPKPKKLKRLLKKITLKRTIISVLLIGLIIGGYVGGKLIYDLQKAFGGNIFQLFETTHLKGEDVGRVNILLAGYSNDDPNHSGADLTDSIMLVSLDTKNNTGWMLSVPRDLWVDIPNYGYQKINAAYEDGQADNFSASGYPNGGMGQLEQIVSQKFSIPIDYYALINYTAFKDAVNAVGGITINIQSTDPRGLFDAYTNLKLPNGPVNLNGQEALNLARARGDNAAGDTSYGFPNSDFDRTMHQRQMLTALKDKATSTGVLANPIKLGNLFDALGNNVKTDLNLKDAKRLYDLSKQIPDKDIQSLSLNSNSGNNLLTSYYSNDGQAALIPTLGINNYSAIQAFVAQYAPNQ